MTTKNTTANTTATETAKPKIIKLNAERYADWKFKQTERSLTEETLEKPRLTHLPQQKRESDSYYFTRKLAFDLTLKEYRTPQKNMELIRDYLNANLPKERQISRFTFVAPQTLKLRFFPANLERDSFIGFDTSKLVSPDSFRAAFGIKTK